jgi:hydrogenase large subunit
MPRLIVGPFNRVEGDLEVRLDIADDRVRSAEVCAPMYRGFEQILVGRPAADALVIVPRICGICSVSQSVAAAQALAALAGAEPPPNGVIATNLMLACENLADHLTHFYLFFMPDFTREVYATRPWFAEARRRFAAVSPDGSGEHHRLATAARVRWFTLMGTLGGKWPHTGSVVPGGSARAIDAAERLRLLAKVREFRGFLERTLVGGPLEELAALSDPAALARWRAMDPGRGDLRLFLTLAEDLALATLGRGPGRTLSHGAYRQPDGPPAFAPGVWCDAAQRLDRFDPDTITEDVTRAWLEAGGDAVRHPARGLTRPDADKPGAYTWNKAPRLAGDVIETGALARQLADGQPLLRALCAAAGGGTVLTRVLARVIELARVVPLMEQWLAALVPREPFHRPVHLPSDGAAVGLTEAARGTLGHWIAVHGGRLAHYQIVAPTSWNFSPRDAGGTPGALEAALVDAPVRPGETSPVAVQHIVRSFDPCMVCTVH